MKISCLPFFKKASTASAAALLAAVVFMPDLNARTTSSIQIEDSTGSEEVKDSAPVRIEMPPAPDRGVRLTTATTSRATPVPDEPIEIRPGSFSPARPAARTPAPTPATEARRPIATPAPVATARPAQPVEEPTTSSDRVTSGLMGSPIVDSTRELPPLLANPTPVPTPEPTATPAPPPPPTPTPAPPAPATAEEATTGSESKPAAPDAPFLPPLVDTSASATVTRSGVTVPVRPEQVTSAALEFTVPDVYQTTLTNGVRFYHYEARDLPRVKVVFLVNAGSNFEQAEKVGLARLTAKTLRAGGAEGITSDDFDRELEQIGSKISIAADREYASGDMFALPRNLDKSFDLLTRMLLKPSFEPAKFELQKRLEQEDLRRQNDEPAEIARREIRKVAYGKDHPLARTATSASLTAINVDDVRNFHDKFYRPASFWIGVSGDISREEAQAIVEKHFGTWDRPAPELPAAPAMVQESDTQTSTIYLIPKMTAQSQIRLAHIGAERHDPRMYAINLMNAVYGTGGFSSRLMNRVRTKRGFVYGVSGSVQTDMPIGLFAAGAASKSRTTVAAINEILDVTREMITGPVLPAELETATRDVVSSFLTEFDTPAEVLSNYMLYDFRGYPSDYLKTFPERIRAVTVADVEKVAREFLHPDKLKILVVGFEKQFDKPLAEIGHVEPWPIDEFSGPQP